MQNDKIYTLEHQRVENELNVNITTTKWIKKINVVINGRVITFGPLGEILQVSLVSETGKGIKSFFNVSDSLIEMFAPSASAEIKPLSQADLNIKQALLEQSVDNSMLDSSIGDSKMD